MAGTVDNKSLVPQEELDKIALLRKEYTELVSILEKSIRPISEAAKGLSGMARNSKEQAEAVSTLRKEQENIVDVSQKMASTAKDIERETKKVIASESTQLQQTRTFGKYLEDILGTRDQNIDRLIKEQAALKQTQEALKQIDKEYKSGRISIDQMSSRKANLINQELVHKQAISELRSTLKSETKDLMAASGSMDQTSQSLFQLKEAYRALSDQDRNSPFGQELLERIQGVDKEIKDLDGTIGNNQRQVGNYADGFRDLNRAVGLVDPSLGMVTSRITNLSGVKRFWLKINEQIVSSLGVTTRTASILQAVVVGLAIAGVGLLVKWLKSWREEQERINQLNQLTARSSNEARIQGSKNAQAEISNLKVLYSATQDTTKSQKERTAAVKELQSLYPDYLGNLSEEDILAGNASGAYDDLTHSILATAQARAAADKIAELSLKLLEIEEKRNELLSEQERLEAEITLARVSRPSGGPTTGGAYYEGGIIRLSAALVDNQRQFDKSSEEADAYRKSIETLTKSINIEDLLSGRSESSGRGASSSSIFDKLNEAEEKARIELALFLIRQNAETEKQISADSMKAMQERLSALQNYVDQQKKVIELSGNYQIESLVSSSINQGLFKNRTDAEEGLSNQIQLIRAKMWAELAKIDEQGARTTESISRQEADRLVKDIESRLSGAMSKLDMDELSELHNLSAGRGPSDEQYQKEREDIIRKYAQRRFEAEQESLFAILDLESLTDEQREEILSKMGGNIAAYAKETADAQIKENEREFENFKRLQEAKKQLFADLVNLASALYSAMTERRLNELDKESEKNKEWADEEGARVERLEESGAISKEQADARKAAIDAKQEAREKEIERRRIEAQRRQAIFEKALTASQTIANTAAAIMAQLRITPLPVGAALVAAIAASGAAQLATILAQPIPQYCTGIEDHKGGPAIVGDGGRPELIILPSGQMFKTPAIDTLVDLPKGTVVKPDYYQAYRDMIRFNPASYDDSPKVVNNIRLETAKTEARLKENTRELKGVKKLTARMVQITARTSRTIKL